MKKGCDGRTGKKSKSIPLPVLNKKQPVEEGIRDSKNSRWRAATLTLLSLLMVAHVIQWRLMGTTVSPIEPSEAMYTLQRGAINAGLIFFSLAIIATLIFGRFVCGWGCHIVALQDLCAWLLKKIGLTPKPFRSRLLIFVPLIAALYMFVWPTLYRAVTKPPDQPLIPEFTNHLITDDFWQTFPTVWVAIPFLFICGFMTVYFLGSKGFCTYACPYGGFFALSDRLAPGKIRVTEDCNQCGHCTATCTSNVLVHVEVKQYGMVVDPGCMKCMDCVSVCPNDALYFGFGKPSFVVPKTVRKTYSLTWPEEALAAIVFLTSFLAVWDVYVLVPMLMALGCAAVTTFVVLKTLKLVRTRDLTFYRFPLRSAGAIRKAGWAFLAFAFLWIGLTVHSGWVRYHEHFGYRSFLQLQIVDELALAQLNPDPWISPAEKQIILSGKQHFQSASSIGLFTNADALSKLGWLEYLSGDAEGSVVSLKHAADAQRDEPKALSFYYRGAILNRLGRYEEANASLDQALKVRDDLILAVVEKGESLWQMGRRAEAVSVWRAALQRNPRLVLAANQLAGAAVVNGNAAEAISYEKQADQATPANPYYHWVLGLRLQRLGMTLLAEKHFRRAVELDPSFEQRRRLI